MSAGACGLPAFRREVDRALLVACRSARAALAIAQVGQGCPSCGGQLTSGLAPSKRRRPSTCRSTAWLRPRAIGGWSLGWACGSLPVLPEVGHCAPGRAGLAGAFSSGGPGCPSCGGQLTAGRAPTERRRVRVQRMAAWLRWPKWLGAVCPSARAPGLSAQWPQRGRRVQSLAFSAVGPNPSIERTSSGRLRLPPAAAHVKR